MFGLFKKSDRPKVDPAELERQEREARVRDTAEKMREAVEKAKEQEGAEKSA